MAFKSKYTGAEVDALLDKIAEDNVGDIDSALSTESENPVMNKVVTEELNKLTETVGEGIPIGKGDAENSAVLKGGNNQTTSECEVALGKYNASNYDTQFSIGIGTSNSKRKNAFEVKQNGDIYIEGVEGRIQDKLNQSIGSSSPMVSVTYSELVNLRDNGELVAGTQYRITDYVATTVQENTQSAGNAFDVIVMATDSTTLSEDARACVHEGDTYFTGKGANLAAWKVMYRLDNDAAKFGWADADNGKGVIYRLIDEWGNDCPYDFKGIKIVLEEGSSAVYTFGGSSDNSIAGRSYGNVIKPYRDSNKQLVNMINLNADSHGNQFGFDCFSIRMSRRCRYNIIGDKCSNNSFDSSCYYNTIGDNCANNTFGANYYYNTIGIGCSNNTFGAYCSNNTIGANCANNTFGNNCSNNTIGANCSNNIFGVNCSYNIFGAACLSNTLYLYYRYIVYESHVREVKLINEDTASDTYNVQHYRVAVGTTSAEINATRNNAYETFIGLDSSGNIKQLCLADLAD